MPLLMSNWRCKSFVRTRDNAVVKCQTYLLGSTSVDHVLDVGNRDGGFGDVGGDHDKASVGRRLLKDLHLLLCREERVEGKDVHRFCEEGASAAVETEQGITNPRCPPPCQVLQSCCRRRRRIRGRQHRPQGSRRRHRQRGPCRRRPGQCPRLRYRRRLRIRICSAIVHNLKETDRTLDERAFGLFDSLLLLIRKLSDLLLLARRFGLGPRRQHRHPFFPLLDRLRSKLLLKLLDERDDLVLSSAEYEDPAGRQARVDPGDLLVRFLEVFGGGAAREVVCDGMLAGGDV